MTKRAVWIVCLIVALLSVGSVVYRLALVTHFDAAAWKSADESVEFLDRRGMMHDVEQMFSRGDLNSQQAVEKTLGPAERTADSDPRTWYYNLGGERSASAPESITWLEVSFDANQRLIQHRTIQELIVPKGE